MPRILAIDYGTKRTGLAVTDPLQIIASGLETVATAELIPYLENYLTSEEVETIVIGEPFYPDGNPAQLAGTIRELARKLQKRFPNVRIALQDERFTSEDAKAIILQSGIKKKKRREKALVDKISAVLILQDFLGHR
ncbi:MAG TPA: Holliday junction resolvase RuvX [Flavilitoribacter sp.]|nr:Holliday junction resolvase RuvX [Flavilitoribacter sp.]HMQ90524.1 Holliday junction resolvase RuvX [Flavilitoribacter sp.]